MAQMTQKDSGQCRVVRVHLSPEHDDDSGAPELLYVSTPNSNIVAGVWRIKSGAYGQISTTTVIPALIGETLRCGLQ